MKKVLAVLIATTLSCCAFFGCGDNDSKPENTDSSSAASSSEPIDISKGATEAMLERSILSEGDSSRIAEKLANVERKPKEITKICFMGDSITQGSAASSSVTQYTAQFQKWWEENMSYYVEFVNAGIGATDSYLGVHRVQEHVLDNQPDIIFIEFINDVDNDFYKASMDSLVRKCLAQQNNPAVILVEMTMDNGTCPQNVHSEIAGAYGVPVISYHDAVMPEIEAGTLKWADISPDNIHPNDAGHTMLAQMLINYIEVTKGKLDTLETTSKTFDAHSPTGDKYANARIADRNSEEIKVIDEGSFTEIASFQRFNNGWSTEKGGSITFEMEFKNLGLAYMKTTDGLSGTVSVSVDGDDLMPISGDFPDGWGDYAKTDEIYTSEETAKHTVTVTVLDGDAQNFQILTWLLS